MWGRRSGDRGAERRVDMLSERAARLAAAGRSAEALAAQREAEGVVRSLRDAHPDSARHARMLAGLLYNIASSLNATLQFEAALQALDECEETYRTLQGRGEPGIAPLLADVHARKGLSYLARRYAASAICEADEAVSAYKGLGAEDEASPHFLDLARVLSINGSVLHEHGDPALAVASADASIRMYLSKAAEINARPDSMLHTRYLRGAARRGLLPAGPGARRRRRCARARVGGLGARPRRRRADHARARAGRGGPDAGRRPRPGRRARHRQRPDRSGQRRVRVGAVLSPGGARDRGDARRARDGPAGHGAVGRPSAGPGGAVPLRRLVARTRPSMRWEFAAFGAAWARLLLACSRAYLADGDDPMVRDLARWLGGVLQQLAPIAIIDSRLTSLVAECEAHQREHLR